MPKFEVNYEFSGFVLITVEAADEDEAWDKIMDDKNKLRPYDATTEQGDNAVFTDGWIEEIEELD